MKESYKKIIEHYENCLKEHGDTHLGVDWPNLEDALTRYKIMLDIIRHNDDNDELTLLDFGCGASHLYEYIKEHQFDKIEYSGLDISKSYVELSRSKYPENTYYDFDIMKEDNQLPEFDYIICNGVFTEKRELSFEEMWDYVQVILPIIFSKAKKGIAFNVMSKSLDRERWDLFHLSADLIIDFMTKNLSRNFILRNDYGLWEYTVYLYK
ncbi:MAG: class I SAM-dependent methyltransferase [Flavobacteriaceae bacterium]|nr:class I SAM-dependent methyltransferase [Flavobacteriaceae bacterium]